MSELYFEKLASFDRIQEPCQASIPFPKGELCNVDRLSVFDGDRQILTQPETLALWKDGSVKWALINFQADLPANKDKSYSYRITDKKIKAKNISIKFQENFIDIDTGKLFVRLNKKGNIFNFIKLGKVCIDEKDITGPVLNNDYKAFVNGWSVVREGPVTAIVEGEGRHINKNGVSLLDFLITLRFFKDKEWFELDYKIINCEKEDFVNIKSLDMSFTINKKNENNCKTEAFIGKSNYKTEFIEDENNNGVYYEIDAKHLIYEANEHFPEVFYGTFFADVKNENGGICAAVFQAYQNYPKALKADKNGIYIYIVPENSNIRFLKGMAKTHTILIYPHYKNVSKEELNFRSLQFQMPDRPSLGTDIYRRAGVFPDIFIDKKDIVREYEKAFVHRMDARGKAYGMLNWGDVPDTHYTKQGRGNGKLVWINNEYDFPHTAMLMYARTGLRRMLDYMLVSARHWLDIDICRCSDDELRLFGQVEHSAEHVSGKVEISHEWVEGLFDYYHATGDLFAYQSAIEIGNNIKRNLKQPRYKNKGEINARETGWALRALVALYKETNNDIWLEDADFIVGHFKAWKEKYGLWLAPYTDHTLIRVPFMISIAIVSLMRYYEIKPNDEIKSMIIEAADDMIDNCILENGLFYYKELPSLKRNGNNTTVLEALVCAYRLTGERKYLDAGAVTFSEYMKEKSGGYSGDKREVEDAVVISGASTKTIAQSYMAVASFYKALIEENIKINYSNSI